MKRRDKKSETGGGREAEGKTDGEQKRSDKRLNLRAEEMRDRREAG